LPLMRPELMGWCWILVNKRNTLRKEFNTFRMSKRKLCWIWRKLSKKKNSFNTSYKVCWEVEISQSLLTCKKILEEIIIINKGIVIPLLLRLNLLSPTKVNMKILIILHMAITKCHLSKSIIIAIVLWAIALVLCRNSSRFSISFFQI
jgi:hypothetical protein